MKSLNNQSVLGRETPSTLQSGINKNSDSNLEPQQARKPKVKAKDRTHRRTDSMCDLEDLIGNLSISTKGVSLNEKLTRRESYNKRKGHQQIDHLKVSRKLRLSNRILKAKLRTLKNGPLPVINEDETEYEPEAAFIPAAIHTEDISICEEYTKWVKDSFKRMSTASDAETDRTLACFCKSISFLITCSQCSNASSLLLSVGNWVFSQIDASVISAWRLSPESPEVSALVALMLGPFQSGGMQPESFFTSARDFVSHLRTNTHEFMATPLAITLKYAFLLTTFFGFKPSNYVPENCMFQDVLSKFEPVAKTTHFDIFDAFLGVTEFAFTAIELFIGGHNIYDFIFPRTLDKDYTDLMHDAELVLKGKPPKVFSNPACVLKAAQDLEFKLGHQLRVGNSILPQYIVRYNGYYANIKTVLQELSDMHNRSSMRIQPFSLCLFGEPGVGKSKVTEECLKIFEVIREKSYSQGARFYWNYTDKFQSGFTERVNVVIFDDISNQKINPNNAGESATGQFVNICNNVPTSTTQPEIKAKGNTYYQNDVCMLTTNIFHMRISDATNEPRSIIRRIVFVEVKVQNKYKKNPSGNTSQDNMIDPSKIGVTNGVADCPWTCAFYEIDTSGGGMAKKYFFPEPILDDPLIIQKIALINQDRDESRYFIEGSDFFRLVALVFKAHFVKQEAYVKQIRDERTHPRCTRCLQYKGTTWCQCIPEVQPESFEFLGQLGTSTAEHILTQVGYKLTTYIPRPSISSFMVKYISIHLWAFSIFVRALGATHLKHYKKIVSLFLCIPCTFIVLFSVYFGTEASIPMSYRLLLAGVILLAYLRTLAIGVVDYTHAQMVLEAKGIGVRGVKSFVTHVSFTHLASAAAILYTSFTIMRCFNNLFMQTPIAEGAMEPTTEAQANERKFEKDQWKRRDVALVPFKIQHQLSTMGEEDKKKLLFEALCCVSQHGPVNAAFSHGFILSKKYILVLKHSWDSFKKSAETPLPLLKISRFASVWCEVESYVIHAQVLPSNNFVILTMDHIFSLRDNTKFLLQQKYEPNKAKCNGVLYTYDREHKTFLNNLIRRPLLCVMDNVFNTAEEGTGLKYLYGDSRPTQSGDCMGIVICPETHVILGFHCGASKEEACGVALAFDIEDLPDNKFTIGPNNKLVDVYTRVEQCDVDLSFIDGSSSPLTVIPELHPRSCVKFMPESDAIIMENGKTKILEKCTCDVMVYGSIPGLRSTPKSEVVYYRQKELIEANGIPCEIGAPRFEADRDHATYFYIATHPMKKIDPLFVEWAREDYLRPLVNTLQGWEKQTPISMDVAINGIPGSRFIRKMNMDTSSGIGYKGKKIVHFDQDPITLKFTPKDYVVTAVNKCIDNWRNGIMCCPLVKTALKDEAVKLPEFNNGKKKVRVFNIYPLHFFLGTKIFLAPLLEFINKCPFTSEQYPNVNVFGDEWTQVGQRHFEKDYQSFDGDFSKLDQHLNGAMLRDVGHILVILAHNIGYSTEDCLAIKTIVDDLSYTYFAYNGTIFSFDGVNTSGNLLTVIFNGISIGIGQRCAFLYKYYEDVQLSYFWIVPSFRTMFLEACRRAPEYRSVVRSGFVGDDSLNSTKSFWFNQEFLGTFWDRYNMNFTPGDKNAALKPFSKNTDIVLCKRKFIYKKYNGKVIYSPALDWSSMVRSILCHKKSAVQSDIIWSENVTNVFRSLAFHEKPYFEEKASILRKILDESDVKHLVPLRDRTYEEWWNVFWIAYYCDHPSYDVSEPTVEDVLGDYEPETGTYTPQSCVIQHVALVTLAQNKCDERIGYQESARLGRDSGLRFRSLAFFVLCAIIHALSISEILWITTTNNNAESEISSQPSIADRGIVTLEHDNPGWVSSFDYAADIVNGDAKDSLTNEEFFARPIKILDFTWEIGVSAFATIDPWSLFLEDPRIANRLAHWKNFRGVLNVEFSLSANVFYYGKLIAAYTPLFKSDTITLCRPGNKVDLIEASQRPHVLLDANASTGGILKCPFIYTKNYVELPSSEYRNLGAIHITTMNELRHVNSGTQGIHVVAYAWMEQVEYSVPTTVIRSTILPQAGMERNDDTEHNAIAGGMHVSMIPKIGRLVTAAEQYASLAMRVGALFGFSRPLVTAKESAHVTFGSSQSNTNTNRFVKSLTLDSHQGVSIDPRIIGIDGTDEMVFTGLAKRECYLTTFNMESFQGNGQLLWNSYVSPIQGNKFNQELHLTPACWVATPFRYWRGTVKYRFQAVCSPMHRARIRIVWDPLFVSGTTTVYNTAYSKILDVSSTMDEEVAIQWGATTSYLSVPSVATLPGHSESPITVATPEFTNGVIAVYVVNTVSAPNEAPAHIEFNVFTSMCDDFEVCEFDPSIFSLFSQSATVVPPQFSPPDVIPDNPSNPTSPIINTLADPYGVFYSTDTQFDPWALTANPSLINYNLRQLLNASDKYRYRIYGSGPKVITVKAENPTNSAGALTMSFGGTPITFTWTAGQINVELTQTLTLNMTSNTFTDVIVTTTNTVPGRVWLKEITNFVPLSDTKVYKSALDVKNLVGSTAVMDGNYTWTSTVNNPSVITLPGCKPNSMVQFIAYSPVKVNGVSFPGTYPTSLPPAGGSGRVITCNSGSTGVITLEGIGGKIYAGSFYYFSTFGPQSGLEEQNNVPAADLVQPAKTMGGPMQPIANKVFFGEQILSWRTLLKRPANVMRVQKLQSSFGEFTYKINPLAMLSITDANYTFTKRFTFFDWVEKAYLGQRGSYVNDFIPWSSQATGTDRLIAIRMPTGKTHVTPNTAFYNSGALPYLEHSIGFDLYSNQFNLTYEYRVPWYNKLRFRTCRTSSATNKLDDLYAKLLWHTPAGNSVAFLCMSAGEDYSLCGFISTPIITLL